MTAQPGDERIIELLKGNDTDMEAGLKILYRSYFSYLKNHILANSGSEQDAEDMFQEVIIAFVNSVRANKFRGDSSIKTFLFALNRNLWLNELKKMERKSAREENFGKLAVKEDRNVQSAIDYRNGLLQALLSIVREARSR